jgi:hypothetical protein
LLGGLGVWWAAGVEEEVQEVGAAVIWGSGAGAANLAGEARSAELVCVCPEEEEKQKGRRRRRREMRLLIAVGADGIRTKCKILCIEGKDHFTSPKCLLLLDSVLSWPGCLCSWSDRSHKTGRSSERNSQWLCSISKSKIRYMLCHGITRIKGIIDSVYEEN